MGRDMPGPAPCFCFLGDQCCQSMWKRGPLQLTLLPRDIHTIPFFSWSRHPPQTETGCEGWGKGEKDLFPLELEGGRIFGGCLTCSSIPLNSPSLLEKEKKKPPLLFTVSVNPCWFLAALGIKGIFMGKDLTYLPFRYQQSKFLYSNCLWSHSLLNSLTSIKVGSFD